MLDQIVWGMGMALRTGAAPLVFALRWSGSDRLPDADGLCDERAAPRWSPLLLSKVLLDELFLATEFVSGAVLSLDDPARVIGEIEAAAELYEARGWTRDPRRFHLRPPALEVAGIESVESAWGDHRHLRFDSGYAPHAGEPGRDRWLSQRANRTAHAWMLEHPGPPRPWLVCIPGYRMGYPAVDFLGFRARWLHEELGLNVLCPVMPLHGPRRSGRRGGDGFLSGNFVDAVHAQAQAVWEVRRLIHWLRARGAPAVGLYGLSLGAYIAALVAGIERNLDCVIAGVPTVDYVALLRSHVPRSMVRAAAQQGFRRERIDTLMRVVSPLAFEPRIARRRRFVYAGRADRLAPPQQAHALWRHWDRPRLRWYNGSHVSFMWEADVQEFLLEALHSVGLLDAPASCETPRAARA